MVKKNEQDIKKFYELLGHKKQTEIRAFQLDKDFKNSKCMGHYFVSSIKDFIEIVKKYNGKYNLYAGLNERKEKGTEAKDVISVKRFFIDIDCKTKPASIKDIKLCSKVVDKIKADLLKEFKAKVTEIYSGNGFQLIYNIPEIKITEENREEVQAKIQQYTKELIEKYSDNKVKLDNVGDLPRIIRITGTTNIKGGKISCFNEISKKENKELKKYILNLNLDLKTTTKLKNKTEQIELNKRFYDILEKDEKIKKLYDGDFT